MFSPLCPRCATFIPVSKALFKLGSTFKCTGCEANLTAPRSNAYFGTATYIAMAPFVRRFLKTMGVFEVFALLACALIFQYCITGVKETGSGDQSPDDIHET